MNMRCFKRWSMVFAFLSIAVVVLSACGGGGGGGGNATTQPSVSGTAASGTALGGATVTLMDSLGSSSTATTASNGTYSVDTTGLTPPFLLLVTAPTGSSFYSVSADANTTSTINITPLTDLIIRSWYDVKGSSVDTAFANPASNPPPAPSIVAVINDVVKNMIQLWLNQAGVTQADFNLISTPFTANGAGIDLVLDNTAVDTSTGQVTISGSGVTQTSLITAGTGSINIVTTTTGTNGTSSSSTNGTVVPVGTTQQTALEGITTTANNFASAVNSKSASTLTASDLLPFLDTSGLYSGLTYTQWAAQVAYVFTGKTISFSGIAIKSLDTTQNTADVVFQLSESRGGQTRTSPQEFFFKKNVSGTWLLSGDDRIAQVEVRANKTRNQVWGSAYTPELVLEVNVSVPRSNPTVTSLSGATITGGPWNGSPLSNYGYDAAPWDSNLISDSSGTYAVNPSISGGQLFTVAVTPVSGPTGTYTQALNAITTEPIMITSLTPGGANLANVIGKSQHVVWTLPTTFAVSQVIIGTVANTSTPNDATNIKCDDAGELVVLGITSTSADVTIPAQCQGQPTLSAEIYLQVYGINGELTTVYYTYNY